MLDCRPALDHLVERVLLLRTGIVGRTVLVGVVGEPGAGKSTLAASVVEGLRARGCAAVLVPMDGFHLANVALAARGLADRKGAIETFDGAIEESVAGAIGVPPGTEVVVTEGNYLLVDEEPWSEVGQMLDEVWAVRADPTVRTERLLARHVQFGRSPEEARAWVAAVDEPNAARIRETLHRADLDVVAG